MPTIAKQLNAKEFPFSMYDVKGNEIYYEDSSGYWCKWEYDLNNNEIYYENSDGDWCKSEYDEDCNEIYYEDSDGHIEDNRPKQVEENEQISTTVTCRGFDRVEFIDRYDNKCSISKSSLANEDCIWLGVLKTEPKILASQAKALGIVTEETTGWVEYPIPEEVFLNTHMHLTQDQVKNILPMLQKFVDTGELV